MTYLRQLELHLDGGTFSERERKSFLFSARCCCNYLERRLRVLRFRSRYSRLIIVCTRDAGDAGVTPLKHEPYLEVIIPFDAKPVQRLSAKATHEQAISALLSGISAASKVEPMPLLECRRALKEFARAGFVNRWVAREKTWTRTRCRAELVLEMTLDRVTLDQRIYVDDALVAETRLAETLPREGLYEQHIGEFALNAQRRIVYRVGKRILTTFDLDSCTFVRSASRNGLRRTPRA
jgi:hypothetical protein